MSATSAAATSLSERLIAQIDALVRDAEAQTRPLEVDPYRERLFELFVTAEGAGYVRAGSEPDLTADGLCRTLAARWGLADAARQTAGSLAQLPAEHVARMRLLWSVMRMWMEWTYAWQRWPEFHPPAEHTS
jgi:hypothetical protein